jgi:hypothetical protein
MKNVLILKPKTNELTGFQYNDQNDLENLIKFVGSAPVVKIESGKMQLLFKKQVVRPGTVVFRNGFGEVTNVMEIPKVIETFDISKTLDFAPDHVNTVTEKVKVVKEKKATKAKK